MSLLKDWNDKFVGYLENNTKKTMIYFYLAITARLLIPIFLFQKVSPFYAILINEIILDFFISPHHYVKYTMPLDKRIYANHYYTDKPLDHWGFAMSLQPVLLNKNKYYNMFEGYRQFLLNLFLFRLLGFILFLIIKKKQIFVLFPNFYLTSYLIISFYSQFKISKKSLNYILFLGMIISIFKEIDIHWKKPYNEDDKDFSIF
jgi:hypothetical protein